MRKILLVLAVSILVNFFISSPGSALDFKDQKVNIIISQSVVSRYIWRGFDLYPDNDASDQPSVNIALEYLSPSPARRRNVNPVFVHGINDE